MPEAPITALEIAQAIDHLDWPIVTGVVGYPEAYVRPTLAQMTSDPDLIIFRSHLRRLNNIYTQLEEIIGNFEIAKVKGIEFSDKAEKRLWRMYNAWRAKLANHLNVRPNDSAGGGSDGGGRIILWGC